MLRRVAARVYGLSRLMPPTHLAKQMWTPEHRRMRVGFIILHSLSLSLVLSLLILIAIKKLKKHELLLSLLVAIVVNSVINLLLAYTPENLSRGLCIVSQASSTAGTVIAASALCSIVIFTWTLLQERAGRRVWQMRWLQAFLLWYPWVSGLIIVIIAALTTIYVWPDDLQVDLYTCYAKDLFADIAHGIAAISILVSFVFEVWAVCLLIGNIRESRRIHSAGNIEALPWFSTPSLTLTFPLRVLTFGITSGVSLGLVLVVIIWPKSHSPGLFQASTGVIGFLVFAPTKDVLEALRSIWPFSILFPPRPEIEEDQGYHSNGPLAVRRRMSGDVLSLAGAIAVAAVAQRDDSRQPSHPSKRGSAIPGSSDGLHQTPRMRIGSLPGNEPGAAVPINEDDRGSHHSSSSSDWSFWETMHAGGDGGEDARSGETPRREFDEGEGPHGERLPSLSLGKREIELETFQERKRRSRGGTECNRSDGTSMGKMMREEDGLVEGEDQEKVVMMEENNEEKSRDTTIVLFEGDVAAPHEFIVLPSLLASSVSNEEEDDPVTPPHPVPLATPPPPPT